jgi:hypothetical protein
MSGLDGAETEQARRLIRKLGVSAAATEVETATGSDRDGG